MISILATAVVTPFMMADQSAAAAPVAVQETAPVYNWENQNAMSIENEEDFKCGASGSFCFVPGGGSMQTVDDWHLA